MSDQVITGEDYTVTYTASDSTFIFQGTLALRGPQEYEVINQLLNEIVETDPPILTIDLKALSFLNSSGISMLSKFVLGLRKKKSTQLVILGSDEMPWQGKSLKNLQKFLPSLRLEVE
jgi:hypothetical protein